MEEVNAECNPYALRQRPQAVWGLHIGACPSVCAHVPFTVRSDLFLLHLPVGHLMRARHLEMQPQSLLSHSLVPEKVS